MINSHYEDLNSAYLVMDDERGTYKLTQYLIELGHKKIATLVKEDDIQGQKRKQGYINALIENSLTINEKFIGEYTTDTQEMYIVRFVREIINAKEKPTAIVCYNDNIALKVMGILREEGIRVPEDMSIVGFDDSSLATASETKLTTIIHPKKNMGIQAAKYLISMIDGKMEKPQYVYSPELIVRNSCSKIVN